MCFSKFINLCLTVLFLKRRLVIMHGVLCLLLSFLIVFFTNGCGVTASKNTNNQIIRNDVLTTKDTANKEPLNRKDNQNTKSKFKITMLDVGQGLSVLIESNGKIMVYDGGNRDYSSYVVSYLKKHNIANIDYLIASHYDEDHIAGLVGILKTASVKNAIIPQYEKDTLIYNSFIKATQSADSTLYAKTGNSYKFGNAVVDILYACNGSEETDNNKSTVIKVNCGGFSCILTGDAEYETEEALVKSGVNLGCVLYVVGHHGSSYSSSPEFVKAMRPEIAFISVGGGNEYGHPTEKTLTTLNNNGVTVYRTDLQGVISLNYDGSKYNVLTEKDLTQKNETMANTTYVLNISSMKFHLPECDSVNKMAFYNKKKTSKNREELIKEGYSPCGACKP